MDEAGLYARLHFDDSNNIVAETARGPVLILKRTHGTDDGKFDDDARVCVGGRVEYGGGGVVDTAIRGVAYDERIETNQA